MSQPLKQGSGLWALSLQVFAMNRLPQPGGKAEEAWLLAPGSAGDRLAFKVPREHLSAVSSLLPRPSPLLATGVFALGGSSGSLRWDKCQLKPPLLSENTVRTL